MSVNTVVGVLAFHGDFAEHLQILRQINATAIEVRSLNDLNRVDRLIIPGGESTVMSRFLTMSGVGDAIKGRVKKDTLAVYGTCAGAILLASKVTGKNAPTPLGLMDIAVDRNAYGSQMQSFMADLKIKGLKGTHSVAFIRAPVITKVGSGVDVLAIHKGNPVLVKHGRLLAGTFHPEVRDQTAVHQMFLEL